MPDELDIIIQEHHEDGSAPANLNVDSWFGIVWSSSLGSNLPPRSVLSSRSFGRISIIVRLLSIGENSPLFRRFNL